MDRDGVVDVGPHTRLAQLDKLPRNTERRQALAARYDAAFADLPIKVPVIPEGRTHVYHQYTIDVGPERDGILAALREAGVGADVYYPVPVHRQEYIMERGLHADLPVTDAAAARTIALPMHPNLTADEQTMVIDAVRTTVAAHVAPASR